MPTRLQQISEFSRQISKQITKNPTEWTSYLTFAARMYKYSFNDKLLIYAQRPDAAACAPMHLWNTKLSHWIKAGSKGIALIRNNNNKPHLEYVFDVADTRPVKGAKEIKVWEISEKQQKSVIEQLEKNYGVTTQGSFEQRLMNIAEHVVNDEYQEYLKNLLQTKDNSFLEELDDDTIQVIFRDTLVASVQYTLLARCGFQADDYFENEDFRGIVNFNTTAALSHIGHAASILSKAILKEIENTVKRTEKELAKSEKIQYNKFNDLKRESDIGIGGNQNVRPNEKENETTNRRIGNHLSSGGGLSDTGYRTGRTAGGHRDLRQKAAELSERTQEYTIFDNGIDGRTLSASGRNQQGGTGTAGRAYGTTSQTVQHQRTAESKRPDEVGSRNEHDKSNGGGNRTERNRVQIIPFPSVEEQLQTIAIAEENQSSAFFIAQSDINHALLAGTQNKESKLKIFDFSKSPHSMKEVIELLKQEYQTGSIPFTFLDGTDGEIWTDKSGFTLKSKGEVYPTVHFSWRDTAKQIYELIEKNQYLSSPEQKEYTAWKERQITEKIEVTEKVENSNVIPFPAKENNKNSLSDSDATDKTNTIQADTPNEFLSETETPNIEAYTNLKIQHPGYLIAVQRKDQLVLYGTDAEQAATAFKTDTSIENIPELGQTSVLHFPFQEWVRYGKQLEKKGYSFLFAKENGKEYEILKAQKAIDKLPIGTEIELNGRSMRIRSVSYEYDSVSLADMSRPSYMPPVYMEITVEQALSLLERKQAQVEKKKEPPPLSPKKQQMLADIMKQDLLDKTAMNEYLNRNPDGNGLDIFLKENYNKVKKDIVYSNGQKGAFETDKNGISLLTEFSISFIDWSQAAKAIHSLYQENSYSFQALDRSTDTPITTGLSTLETATDTPIVDSTMLDTSVAVDTSALETTTDTPIMADSTMLDKTTDTSIAAYTSVLDSVNLENYHITDYELGYGGAKTKFQYNATAIQTLKQIESENRPATPEEQEILAKYVGWGGIYQAFDKRNENWTKEYTELKELLTESEYESARRTTLTSFYTPPAVSNAIYKAIKQTGTEINRVLEPSCGTGHFFGLLPEELQKAQLYGIELDSITGRIAKQLYPKANITISGYQNTNYPDNYFDMAIGNIPFGSFKVPDKRYDKHNFSIHDYFFAKTIDKVKPGGIIAFVTSSFVMDKQNKKSRTYIAQRADLLGAIRLPNNAFKKNANTEVTTDILFLRKRNTLLEKELDWLNTGVMENGVPVNQYFIEHPEMILGEMVFSQKMYGNEKGTTCMPLENKDLTEQLETAVENLNLSQLQPLEIDDIPDMEEENGTILVPNDSEIENFSYAIVDNQVFFRENNLFLPVEEKKETLNRIKGLIAVRDTTRHLIQAQTDDADEEIIKNLQETLNYEYDTFTNKYGLINSKTNKKAFSNDSSYPLLCSLEELDENKQKLVAKAEIFYKRTIMPHRPVTHVDTAQEALAVSLSEKACVDLGYMGALMGGSEYIEKIKEDLRGIIFKNPESGNDPFTGWETADEYLSGNVRRKLEIAKTAAIDNPDYQINAEKLEQVQPKDLSASEIEVHIGTPWIESNYYKQFLFELLETSFYYSSRIDLEYSPVSNKWNIQGKQIDRNNIRATKTYGTPYCNAYELFERLLNQQDAVVYKTIEDINGSKKRIIDSDKTAVIQQKSEDLQEAFKNWIWKDPKRRDILCRKYNDLFNNVRPREYDGSHIIYNGMNHTISLRPHQANAVARVLYGKNNALLAHVVGAGKTFAMIAAAMESKRLGLTQKSLFVVPNHLTEQWGQDFLKLYPGSKVLVATKKDFEKENRRKFCARIATGNYDAVVISHSQFGKIPITPEREEQAIREEIEQIVYAIEEAKENGESKNSFTVKQMEKTKESLYAKLVKLQNSETKDNTIYFEQLGVDRLFVDEAHEFKNLYVFSKMRNVSGINNTNSMKASDMYTKCNYINEITNNKGIVFATGTPVSNSMTELYTMMRYLQGKELKDRNMAFFDNWAANFGEKTTAMEIAPEGTGFRLKTRFARFFNLPELIKIWKECTDVQTADMLHLPTPKPEFINVVTKPSEHQQNLVQSLADRAEKVRNREVSADKDNMLLITNDGRKLALDQRLVNPLLPDNPESKVYECAKNILENYKNSSDTLGTQLVFCDMSTPSGNNDVSTDNKENGEIKQIEETPEYFENVYDDLKKKLIQSGIPKEEIAFIHDAKTDIQKEQLFAKVRTGKIRVLIGSTAKMGAGTNVQKRLVALHHLDCPWRPSDLERASVKAI